MVKLGLNIKDSSIENTTVNNVNTFDVCNLLGQHIVGTLFERGAQAIRLDDANEHSTLEERVKKANANLVDLVLTIDVQSELFETGITTFIKAPISDNTKLLSLAVDLQTTAVQSTKLVDNGIKGKLDYINLKSKTPAIYMEIGNVNNMTDAKVLSDEEVISILGKQIADVIIKHLK